MPETQTLKNQIQNLIEKSITEKRTVVVVVRWRESDGYYNYQTRRVFIIKPILRWEEEEGIPMVVDMPISIFDNVSIDDIDRIIEELREQYEEDIRVEKIVF